MNGAARINWERCASCICVALFALFPVVAAWAQEDPHVQRGMRFARANCARCHSIDLYSESPLKIAPPFRTLHLKYPVEGLEESLAEGIVVGHPTMPEFRLEPDQIADLIAFLKSLER
jgi:mono/diheme cytochrome c family protein